MPQAPDPIELVQSLPPKVVHAFTDAFGNKHRLQALAIAAVDCKAWPRFGECMQVALALAGAPPRAPSTWLEARCGDRARRALLAQAGYCALAQPGCGASAFAAQLDSVCQHVERVLSEHVGDREAVLMDYQPLLQALAAQRQSHRAPGLEAEDLLQHAMLHLWAWMEQQREAHACGKRVRLPSPEAEPELPLRTWVHTVADRAMQDQVKRMLPPEGTSVCPDLDVIAGAHDRTADPLRAAQARDELRHRGSARPAIRVRDGQALAAAEWEVALLDRLGVPTAAIAAILHVPRNAIYLARRRAALKRQKGGNHD